MEEPTVRVVPRSSEIGAAGSTTPGLLRFEAFAGEDRWVGYTTTVPGVMSGWHHHGGHDTYFYMVKGTIEIEFGADGQDRVTASPGDFVQVPAGAIHREGTPPGEPAEAVVVRVGSGTPVVDVDGPAAS